jgi:hypothetical protein
VFEIVLPTAFLITSQSFTGLNGLTGVTVGWYSPLTLPSDPAFFLDFCCWIKVRHIQTKSFSEYKNNTSRRPRKSYLLGLAVDSILFKRKNTLI